MTKTIVNQGVNGADAMRMLGKLEFVVSVHRTLLLFLRIRNFVYDISYLDWLWKYVL